MTSDSGFFHLCVITGDKRWPGNERSEGRQRGGRLSRAARRPWEAGTSGESGFHGYVTCHHCDRKKRSITSSFRAPKETPGWGHQAAPEDQVSQVWAFQDGPVHLGHQGLQDPLHHPQDTAQVQFVKQVLLYGSRHLSLHIVRVTDGIKHEELGK